MSQKDPPFKFQPQRLLAIGDIHGYKNKLANLLQKVQPTDKDLVVFIGDYIDRGPDSRGVIELLIQFHQQFPQTVFLRGNHEDMLLNLLCHPHPDNFKLYRANGGDATIESYGTVPENFPEQHLGFVRSTKFFYQHQAEIIDPSAGTKSRQNFLFVHAGVRPQKPLEEQAKEDLLWIRSLFLESPRPLGDTIVVHGHTPTDNVPSREPYRIALDSGVYLEGSLRRGSKVMGGKLSCCNVLTREIWQA